MAYKAVIQFLEATSNDKPLKEGLAGVIGVGDGDISTAQELDHEEAQALLGKRGVLVTAFAEQHGYEFTLAELNAVISVFQQYQAGEMSEEDFSKAMGLSGPGEKASAGLETLGNSVGLVYRGVKYKVEKNPGSAHQVLDFMKKSSEDPDFKQQLKEILSAGDGDISDFSQLDADEVAALRSGRGALVAEFAAKHGFVFTLSDLLAVTDAFQRVQSGELTSDEFDRFLDLDVKSKEFFPFIQNVVSLTYKGFKYSAAVASKTNDNTLPVIRFMERSATDETLRGQLMAILGGDGDISAPAELDAEEASVLGGERSKQIVELGAQYGHRFAASDLSTVVDAFQLVNEGKLPPESCARILGLGKSATPITGVKKTAGLIYRGVRM